MLIVCVAVCALGHTGNGITNEGAVSIGKSLEKNTTLLTLQLHGEGLHTYFFYVDICRHLSDNVRGFLCEVSMCVTQQRLVMLFANNDFAGVFVCAGNAIGGDGVRAILMSLERNTKLTSLDADVRCDGM